MKPKFILITVLILVCLPLSIRAGEPTNMEVGGIFINDTTPAIKYVIQTYTCHASTAAALRDHVNNWLDSVRVELISIQYLAYTELVPTLDTFYASLYLSNDTSDTSASVYRKSQSSLYVSEYPSTKSVITHRAWITYRDERRTK